jgi:non-homologous end joining protein Ku
MARVYVSDFTIQLDLPDLPFAINVDLVTAKITPDDSLRSICPDCSQPLHEKLYCENEHGPFTQGEVSKAKETKDGLVKLDEADLQKIKDPRPKGLLVLAICPRDELEAATFSQGNIYRLHPAKKSPPGLYAYLLAMANHPKYALYGMAKTTERFSSTPFVLDVRDGTVVMRQLIAPQNVAEAEDLGYLPAGEDKIHALLEALSKPLDVELFANHKETHLAEIIEKKAGDVIQVKSSVPAVTDLTAALEASLAKITDIKPRRTRRKAS